MFSIDPPPHARQVRSQSQRSLAALRRENLRRMQLAQQSRLLHRLGERAVFEAFDEISRRTRRRAVVERVVQAIAALDPDLVAALGGDRLPPSPLRLIQGGS
jgi:hypothetical protein